VDGSTDDDVVQQTIWIQLILTIAREKSRLCHGESW